MKTGWLIGIISAFVIISFIAGVCENAWYGTEVVTKLDVLMRPFMAAGVWEGIKAAVGTVFSTDFWDTLWDVLWWNYPFDGTFWMLTRYIMFIPLSLGFIFTLALAVVRGVSSS
jgi:hypothetical protein